MDAPRSLSFISTGKGLLLQRYWEGVSQTYRHSSSDSLALMAGSLDMNRALSEVCGRRMPPLHSDISSEQFEIQAFRSDGPNMRQNPESSHDR
jgi:hypothetical protein